MTAYHVLYIPAVLAVGVAIGTWLGRRALTREIAEREAEERERAARIAARTQHD